MPKRKNANKTGYTAPAIDGLLNVFNSEYRNLEPPNEAVVAALRSIFDALSDLAPTPTNNEVKTIWLRIPRGGIRAYIPYSKMRAWGEVRDYQEYKARWAEDYPQPVKWYRLLLAEEKPTEKRKGFLVMSLEDKTVASVSLGMPSRPSWPEDAYVCELCTALLPFIETAMQSLRDGKYNRAVEEGLPYWKRTGVLRRADLWAAEPEYKAFDWDDTVWERERHRPMDEETLQKCEAFLADGKNTSKDCGRLPRMTAGEFFHVCALGYAACGYRYLGEKDGTPYSDVEQYQIHADGRTEGLIGNRWDADARGIPLDDPDAWDRWYFDNGRFGGHPWEVVRGGNSTHVSLCPCSDRPWNRQDAQDGWYFCVAGKHRASEAVNFYVALREAGYPVILEDAEEIVARFRGTDYVGIVPHGDSTKYCESKFPKKYGSVIDAIHVEDEDMAKIGTKIEWLPPPKASLITKS